MILPSRAGIIRRKGEAAPTFNKPTRLGISARGTTAGAVPSFTFPTGIVPAGTTDLFVVVCLRVTSPLAITSGLTVSITEGALTPIAGMPDGTPPLGSNAHMAWIGRLVGPPTGVDRTVTVLSDDGANNDIRSAIARAIFYKDVGGVTPLMAQWTPSAEGTTYSRSGVTTQDNAFLLGAFSAQESRTAPFTPGGDVSTELEDFGQPGSVTGNGTSAFIGEIDAGPIGSHTLLAVGARSEPFATGLIEIKGTAV